MSEDQKPYEKTKSEIERVVEALAKIRLRVSYETAQHIILSYHSCALEGCSLTLEETAQTIGFEIIEDLKKANERKN